MSTNIDDSVFDDVMKRPPKTDATTGTWDDDGPIRGWTFRQDGTATLLDLVLERHWTTHGLTCLLLRVTEYFEFSRLTQDTPDYGENETYYRGYVHAPGVESFPKGYRGTYISDCTPDDGWYSWDERSFENRPGYGQSMRESAIGKTETLARGLTRRMEGEI